MSLVIVETDTGEEYEIVLCQDCKNYYPEDKPHQKRGCMYGGICERPDDFCSRGEKR